MLTKDDHRYLDACLRFARRHRGLTGTNPSVGTLLVKDGCVVGKGITALGGRPHAERVALDQAGDAAKGATAYVSLEPCAHHGATPPCATAFIEAGVARVVTAWTDPDRRVDGKGHEMLREAGIAVQVADQENSAPRDLAGYLNRKQKDRPQVTLKLAVSADGMLGRPGEEVAITGRLVKNMVHRLRAEHDGILVGRGTVDADNPDLTCRLPGLGSRSPHRFVLDTNASMSVECRLARSARDVPVSIVSAVDKLPEDLAASGVNLFAAESHAGHLALPEFLEDFAGAGMSSLMVEGGAEVARSFLDQELVDFIWLFTAPTVIGEAGIVSPIPATATVDAYLQAVIGMEQVGELEIARLGYETAAQLAGRGYHSVTITARTREKADTALAELVARTGRTVFATLVMDNNKLDTVEAAAVTLAVSSRHWRWPEARWLVYPVLILVGIKLFAEDFPNGQPATLFVALAFVGSALILVAKLLNRPVLQEASNA